MRIGLLTWAYPPEKSGLTRAAREIAQALAGEGHRVTVFTMDRRGRSSDGAVDVVGCGLRPGSLAARLRTVAAVGHLVAPIAFRAAVAAEHVREPFDVIEGTNWYAPGVLIAMTGPAPFVMRNSTPAATSAAGVTRLRDRIDRRAAMLLEGIAARASSGLISNTSDHRTKVALLYGVHATAQGHAVIGLSLPPEIVARGRAALYRPGERVEMLFIGRDEHRKGFDALLDALAILVADELPAFHMTVIGAEEASFAQLSTAVRSCLTAFHRVPETKLHGLLGASDIVVAPSRYESFGLVYQEAMMFGRPIVACAEDPSARLFVGDTGAGLLAAQCSGEALAKQLRRVIIDPELRCELASASRAASGRFTRETLAGETAAAYRTAILSKGSRRSASSSGRPAPADIVS